MHYALFDLNHRRNNLQSVCPFHFELNDIRKKHTYVKHLSRDQSEGKVGKKGRSKPCRTFRKGEFPLISMLPFFTGLGSFSSSGHSSTSIGPLVLVRWMDKLWGKVQKKKLIKNIKSSRFWNVWKNFQIFNCNLSMLGEKWLPASKYYCKKKSFIMSTTILPDSVSLTEKSEQSLPGSAHQREKKKKGGSDWANYLHSNRPITFASPAWSFSLVRRTTSSWGPFPGSSSASLSRTSGLVFSRKEADRQRSGWKT